MAAIEAQLGNWALRGTRPMIRMTALALAATLVAPVLCMAQELDGVIATGPSGSASPAMTTDQKVANILAGARAEDGVERQAAVDPRKIHGEAGVSVGSDGYRSAYVHTIVPVGETGAVALSYSQSKGGRGYGPGYGYDGPIGGRFGGRAGDNRSFGLAMDFDTTKREAASDCRPAFRGGGQPVEPLWASEIRGRSACEAPRAD
jgi:hypothetical protein